MPSASVPQHTAIIMDGNGRWAAQRGLPVHQGHEEGFQRLRALLPVVKDLGIAVLSVFAFSTENWRRSQAEVQFLMQFLHRVLGHFTEDLLREQVRLVVSGSSQGIAPSLLQEIADAEAQTAHFAKHTLNIAFNYGGREEITRASRAISEAVLQQEIQLSDISEDLFAQYLYHPELPSIDLLVRTSGEQRISNFMLWQLSYAEIFFDETLWPDYGASNLHAAVSFYQGRERRYGKRKERFKENP